MLKKKVLLKNQ